MRRKEVNKRQGHISKYQEGLHRLDWLIEQMEGELQALRAANLACLDRLQEFHPEWKYRIILSNNSYQIVMRDTETPVCAGKKPLAFSRAEEAWKKQQKLEHTGLEFEQDRKQEVRGEKKPTRFQFSEIKVPGKH